MSDLTDNADDLTEALTACLFNPRMADEVTDAVLRLDQSTQAFVFERIVSVAKTQPEIAYQFALQAKHAINLHGREVCEHWLQKSLDRFFTDGLHAALQVMKDLDGFILEYQQQQKGLRLADIRGILQNFINGLGGRALDIEAGGETCTDTEKVYLPAVFDFFEDKNQNFASYRAMLAHLWAQNYYGTWRINLKPEIKNNPDLLNRFHYLETLRLNACIARDFPGLWRQMYRLDQISHRKINAKSSWLEIEEKLSTKNTSVSDSLSLLPGIKDLPLPKPFCYQGILKPDSVEKRRSQRLLREKNQFQFNLAKLADKLDNRDIEKQSDLPEKPQIKIKQLKTIKSTKNSYEIELDGVVVPPNVETDGLITSILQDLGEMPPEYLVATNPASYNAGIKALATRQNINKTGSADKNTYFYPEWDSNLKTHRKQWCVLREKNHHR